MLFLANFSHWYTSLDVSFTGKVMLAGDNKGYVRILSVDGEQISQIRLHKQKVTHAEFNPRSVFLSFSSFLAAAVAGLVLI